VRPFAYLRPTDDRSALHAAAENGSEAIAGGTGMVDLLRLGVSTPARLVDLAALAWSRIERSADGGLRIGALVKNSDLAYHPDVQERFPALSQALLSGASPQLRNMASTGGNLLQRTRCSYFRDVAIRQCNKRLPGSGCAAIGGDTRMHAVLGGSDACIAVHPSDMCVALVALDAVVRARGPNGERDIPVEELHVLPGARPDVESVLRKGELVTHVILKPSPWAARSVYVKLRDRASFAFALASAAVALDVAGGTIRTARVALGGVATKPWRSHEAEHELVGQAANAATFRRAAAAAMENAQPRGDNAFKVELGRRVVVRSLERAAGAA
jgi:xanthine dehydrogenase YagS FAD-binding subunit